MVEWIQRLAPVPDEASFVLNSHLENEEVLHRESAAKAVLDFDQKKWISWSKVLTARTHRIPLGSVVFRHLALERLHEARELHRRAADGRPDRAQGQAAAAAFTDRRLGNAPRARQRRDGRTAGRAVSF